MRTPLGKGKPGGWLSSVHPVDLLAHSIRAVVERSGIDPALIDDVIGGCVTQLNPQASNLTRYAALAAGLPESVPATTVDRQCGSSQRAAHFAAQGVIAGAYDMAIACGVESMSRVPMFNSMPQGDPFSPGLAARYPAPPAPQGVSAELIAAKWDLSRARLDEYSYTGHQRAAAAHADSRFATEISRVKAGSAAVLITTSQRARELGLTPRARLYSFAVVGDDPVMMLTGIIPATARVLASAGLALGDIDAFEVNEAFASVVLAWQAETGADLAKVNINGGAVALGHPLGASGARLLTTLVNVLEQTEGRYGLQTMCEAGGQDNATIIERIGWDRSPSRSPEAHSRIDVQTWPVM